MIINRADYIAKLSAKSWNGKVKIITGLYAKSCIEYRSHRS